MKKALLVLAAAALLTPALAGASTSLLVTGMGKVGASSAGCGGLAQGCLNATGTFKGRPIALGSWTAKFTVDWSHTVSIAGATCATAGGTVDITGKSGNSLTLDETGKICKGGKSAYPYRFNGSYTIDAGGGIYATEGTGKGKASWQVLPANRLRLNAVGSFALSSRPPQ